MSTEKEKETTRVPMQYRYLGRTGLRVSVLSFGYGSSLLYVLSVL